MNKTIKLTSKIAKMYTEQVVVIYDEKGRKYIWDGVNMYRLRPIKGRK